MLSFIVPITLVLALGVVPATAAQAGPASDQLKLQIDRVMKAIDDPELKKEHRALDRRKSVRKIAEDIFDFGETAKRSLGRHWLARTAAEREEFVGLFADLLERSYISKGDTPDGDQTIVRTKVITKQGTEVPVDYRMLKKGDRWLVYDVIIEGVSLVANYRTQFNKIIQTSSFQELVKKMKTKQEEFIEQEKQQQQTQRTS